MPSGDLRSNPLSSRWRCCSLEALAHIFLLLPNPHPLIILCVCVCVCVCGAREGGVSFVSFTACSVFYPHGSPPTHPQPVKPQVSHPGFPFIIVILLVMTWVHLFPHYLVSSLSPEPTRLSCPRLFPRAWWTVIPRATSRAPTPLQACAPGANFLGSNSGFTVCWPVCWWEDYSNSPVWSFSDPVIKKKRYWLPRIVRVDEGS